MEKNFSSDTSGTATQYYYYTTSVSSYSGLATIVRAGSIESVKSVPWPRKKPYPQNPFSYYFSEIVRSPGSYGAFYPGWGRYQGIQGDAYGFISASGSSGIPSYRGATVADVTLKARSKILDKIKNQKVNVAQMFAERRQTANLMITTVNRLASAALAIRKGRIRHATTLFGKKVNSRPLLQRDVQASPENLSNYWLEYIYGWRPLLDDIYGSAELLADSYLKNRPEFVKSFSEMSVEIEDQQIRFNTGGTPGSFYAERMRGSSRAQARFVVGFSVENSMVDAAQRTGLTNPLALAWELVPYSFVVDWILPIGNYLSHLDTTTGLVFHSGSESSSLNDSLTTYWTGSKKVAEDTSVEGCGRVITVISKNRSILSDFPSAAFPRFDPNLGATRLTTALALLTSAFNRAR